MHDNGQTAVVFFNERFFDPMPANHIRLQIREDSTERFRVFPCSRIGIFKMRLKILKMGK